MKSMIDGTKATTIRPCPSAQFLVTTTSDVAPVSNHESRRRFMRGCERLFAASGPLKELQNTSDELTAVENRLAVKRTDHVGPAAAAAGKALFKVLGPTCFNDAKQATVWARANLPLSDAWRQVADDEDQLARDRNSLKMLRDSFWTAAGDLALRLAKHAGGSPDNAIFEVTETGSWG